MRWYPATTVPGVEEVTEFGMTYGIHRLGRVWAGDDVQESAITAGPAHEACDAELAARQANAGSQ